MGKPEGFLRSLCTVGWRCLFCTQLSFLKERQYLLMGENIFNFNFQLIKHNEKSGHYLIFNW